MRQTLELWQTEWCPASHRIRQRLTELGLTYVVHQVPVRPDERTQLESATGGRSIPVLVTSDKIVAGKEAILTYLRERFVDPSDAISQREKAARAKRKELEEACPKLAAATH
ncbi:MAG TPA: glutaredoxin domain-containing protein [Solirubrobacteraceae bacterium]|nr:glutaredoxin domain-containing protein [Solirubrobacteraceae bacterium]